MRLFFPKIFSQGLPATADLTDLVSCNKYAYICARVRKDDPTPDYKQIGKDKTGCAPVICASMCNIKSSIVVKGVGDQEEGT